MLGRCRWGGGITSRALAVVSEPLQLDIDQCLLQGTTGAGRTRAARAADDTHVASSIHADVREGEEDVALLAAPLDMVADFQAQMFDFNVYCKASTVLPHKLEAASQIYALARAAHEDRSVSRLRARIVGGPAGRDPTHREQWPSVKMIAALESWAVYTRDGLVEFRCRSSVH